MATRRLNITRNQLATFLRDPELIKQFELLFAVTQEVPDQTEQINDVSLQASIADAKAAMAIAMASGAQESSLAALLRGPLFPEPSSDPSSFDLMPPESQHKRQRYGSFYDLTNQVAAAINTPTAIVYSNVDIDEGVYLSNNSRLNVDTEGVYNFQFSVQLDKTSGGTALFYIWPRINGVDHPDSASQMQVQGNNAEIFSSANFFLDLKAGDYVEFMFAVSDVSVQLAYFAATGFCPAIPSIIVTASTVPGAI